MNDFTYDHLIIFSNDFDESVIDQDTAIPDKSPEFKLLVQGKFNNLLYVLTIQPGVKEASTFLEYNNIRYKITVIISI